MSLFKLKHLWIQSFPEQQFDEHHLAIGIIDGQPALALGSFGGRVRVFVVSLKDKEEMGVKCVYEVDLGVPVIAVQFVEHPEEGRRNTIGVLVFRRFYYIALSRNREDGSYQGRSTSITVQPAFAIQPNTLSLMTINSSIQYLNPLSTQPLKSSSPIYPFTRHLETLFYCDGQQLIKIQNSSQQWRIIVGPMRSLFMHGELVIVIGDNALWEIKESEIVRTKVMDEEISCGLVVGKGQGEGYNVVVGDFGNRIRVYNDLFVLIWAIKAEEVPIRMLVFRQQFLNGALAILGEEGTVSISYLGSQLPETEIQALSEQIDMQQVQAQTSRLLAQLKQQQQSPTAPKSQQQSLSQTTCKLTLTSSPPKKTPTPSLDNPTSYLTVQNQPWCCQLDLHLQSQKQILYNVVVTVRAPSNITCLEAERKFVMVKGVERWGVGLLCSAEKFCFQGFVEVVVRYEVGERRRETCVLVQRCELPMDFQCSFKSLELEEKPTNKIVFKAQSDLPAFSQIFHQFQTQLANSKNLTVKLPNGVLCSMGYNKNNTKVKIQSNFFSGLCFMFVVFNSRFERLIKQKKIAANELSIDDIPLEEFFSLMKDHFGLRALFKQRTEELEKKCEEFRNTQKKLIIKMKEKVSSINNIDKLLEYTYKKLIEAADAFENTRQEMESVNHNLEIAIKFVLELLFMKTKATTKCREKVQGIIGYEKECNQYGWQQKIMSNSSHFLNKKFNYSVDKYSFDQLYKTALWVISKINSGQWNQ